MGLELFWLLFGAREAWLFGDRMGEWDATGSPINGFFTFGIMCAGLLCFSAANEPLPTVGRQSIWVLGAVAVTSGLLGMLFYRALWG